MSDFSAYGGTSKEWVEAAKTITPAQAKFGDLTVEEKRTIQNGIREQLAAEGFKSMKDQLVVQDHTIPTRDGSHIEARTYRPAKVERDEILPIYIHYHGGGFMTGTIASEDAVCGGIAIDAGVIVLNVNYRHTPEFVYPTAWNDSEDAFEWLHDNMKTVRGDPEAVVIGGISAGAWLTASLILRKHLGQSTTSSRPPVAGQVLMIPCLLTIDCFDPHRQKLQNPAYSSYEQNAEADILPLRIAKEYNAHLKFGAANPEDLRLNPGNATTEQITGLPPTAFGIAGTDILRDEGLLYAKMLAENGVPTDVNVFPGVPHGFRRFGPHMPVTAARWDKVMVDGIRWALGKPKASGKFDIKTE